MGDQADFDAVARPYRWLEYLTLGRALKRAREHFLPRLTGARSALVLGDGDGRFLARLLAANPVLRAEAVDTSAAMLALLAARCSTDRSRLTTHQVNALEFVPERSYDLICTHFFLDCLTQAEVERLVATLVPALEGDDAVWLVSDFRVPPTGLMRWPARVLIRGLYLAFGVLTGLRVTKLPDYARVFTAHGLMLRHRHLSLGGVLSSELWQGKRF
jgi:SAM-dependent methyltransferase